MRRLLYGRVVSGWLARLFARLHGWSYALSGRFAAASEGGLHPKHRLTAYHRFFEDNVEEGESVLDVGCGNGEVLMKVAGKTGCRAVGVDRSSANVEAARGRLRSLPNAGVVEADIWEYDDTGVFDVVMMSNVLEHMDRRVELLMHLDERFRPRRFLLRVPMFDREWLVPYKKELGLEWRLDRTHEVEYTEQGLRDELSEAGLDVRKMAIRWGEIYAVAVPRQGSPEGSSDA